MVHSACLVTPGSENRANDHKGSPGNLGDPVVSIVPAGRSPAYQLQADLQLPVPSCGDEPGTKRWYRQAKETKRGEMVGRESQCPIVPMKRGNQPEGPREGKEAPSHDPLKGNMPGTSRPESCPRNDDGSRRPRIHGMTNRVREICTPGSVGGATRSYGWTCYDWSYDRDVTQCATTDTLPRRAAGVTWRCEALGTT
jgi:hypothetical protein